MLSTELERLLREFASVIEAETVAYRELLLSDNPPDIFLTLDPTYITNTPDKTLLSVLQVNGGSSLPAVLKAGYVPHLGWFSQFDGHPLKSRLSAELHKVITSSYPAAAGDDDWLNGLIAQSVDHYIYETIRVYLAILFRRPFSREGAFSHAIDQLDARINPERAGHFSSCFLYNFELENPDAAPIQLDDDVELRLSTFEDMRRRLAMDNRRGEHLSAYILSFRQSVSHPLENAIHLGGGGWAPAAIDNALTALRLNQAGYVGRGQISSWSTGLTINRGEYSWFLDSFVYSYIKGSGPSFPEYKLKTSDIEQVKKIYQGLRDLGGHSKLNVAVTRFNDSYRRSDAGERIVDLVIALESMFGKEAIKQTTEVGYRLRMRAAKYIGDSATQRKEIASFIPTLYSFRSSIVHGESKEVEKLESRLGTTLNEIATKTEDLVRRALLKMLANPQHQNGDYLNNLLLDAID